MQGRPLTCRRSRGRSGRGRRGRCPRASRRRGSCRSGGRSRSSCRCRARPGAARPRRWPAPVAGTPARARPSPGRPRRRAARARRPRRRRPPARGGTVEAQDALGAVLVRAGEDLAAGHVALAVAVDPPAAADRQAQVGALGLDADLARPRQPRDQRRPGTRRAAARRHGVGPVQEQGARRRTRRTPRRPSRPGRRARASATAWSTSAASCVCSRT